jgi:hypothetical protein
MPLNGRASRSPVAMLSFEPAGYSFKHNILFQVISVVISHTRLSLPYNQGALFTVNQCLNSK